MQFSFFSKTPIKIDLLWEIFFPFLISLEISKICIFFFCRYPDVFLLLRQPLVQRSVSQSVNRKWTSLLGTNEIHPMHTRSPKKFWEKKNVILVSTFISGLKTTIPRVPWWLWHGSLNLWASWFFLRIFIFFFFYLWEEKTDSKIKRFVSRLHNSEKQHQRATQRSGNQSKQRRKRKKKRRWTLRGLLLLFVFFFFR